MFRFHPMAATCSRSAKATLLAASLDVTLSFAHGVFFCRATRALARAARLESAADSIAAIDAASIAVVLGPCAECLKSRGLGRAATQHM